MVYANVRRCRPENTLVFTKEGLKKISEIRKGTNVLTSKGYSKVIENIHQGDQKMYSVKTQLGELLCTDNHRLAVLDTEKTYIWKQAKDLTIEDRLVFPTEKTEGIPTKLPGTKDFIVPELDSDLAWFFGYFHGNGCSSENRNEITISCPINDNIINTVEKQLLKFTNNIGRNIQGKCQRLKLYGKYAKYLSQFKKSWTSMNVPDFILQGTEEIRSGYLAGLYDSDGTARTNKRLTVLVSSVYPEYLLEVQSVYASLSIPVRHKLVKTAKKDTHKDLYELQIVGKYSKNLWKNSVGKKSLRYIPNDYKNHTRYSEDYSFPRSWFLGVEKSINSGYKIKSSLISVDEYYDRYGKPDFIPISVLSTECTDKIVNTYDISVENNHEYFCGEGILNHNSAELSMGSISDRDFINLKNYSENPERAEIGWMSNNSVVLKENGDFADFTHIPEIADRIRENGEPGIINLYNIQKYGRFGKEMKDEAILVNPCSEVNLCSTELCNLSEIFPPRCQSPNNFYKALEYGTFYASTVSLLPSHRTETNAIIAKNRRIGVSISGIAQWVSGAVPSGWGRMDYTHMTTYLRKAYKLVRNVNTKLAKEAGVPPSVRVTTIKPSGSISLLAGCTPGMHYPTSRFAIRRMRIGHNSPLVQPLIEAGIPHEKDKYSDNTLVFEFVVDHGNNVRACHEVSPWEQLILLATLQRVYSDNSVSATITFDKEKDGPDIEKMLAMFIPVLKSLSMLPHSNHGYAQAPYEAIDEKTYHKRLSEYKSPNFDSVVDNVPEGTKYCSNDTCDYVPMRRRKKNKTVANIEEEVDEEMSVIAEQAEQGSETTEEK